MKMKILQAVLNWAIIMTFVIQLQQIRSSLERLHDQNAALFAFAARVNEHIDMNKEHWKTLYLSKDEELRRCRIEAFRLSQCILTNAPQ